MDSMYLGNFGQKKYENGKPKFYFVAGALNLAYETILSISELMWF